MHKQPKMHRESLFFMLFFLTAALLWIMLSLLMLIAAENGLYDYHLAVRYVPEMINSALFSVPLSLLCGVIYEINLRQET